MTVILKVVKFTSHSKWMIVMTAAMMMTIIIIVIGISNHMISSAIWNK